MSPTNSHGGADHASVPIYVKHANNDIRKSKQELMERGHIRLSRCRHQPRIITSTNSAQHKTFRINLQQKKIIDYT